MFWSFVDAKPFSIPLLWATYQTTFSCQRDDPKSCWIYLIKDFGVEADNKTGIASAQDRRMGYIKSS